MGVYLFLLFFGFCALFVAIYKTMTDILDDVDEMEDEDPLASW